jgi:hypothetical protein
MLPVGAVHSGFDALATGGTRVLPTPVAACTPAASELIHRAHVNLPAPVNANVNVHMPEFPPCA